MDQQPAQILNYSAPKRVRRLQSTWGHFSVVFAVFGIVAIAAELKIGDSHNAPILLVFYLLTLLAGIVCGIVGVCQRSCKRTAGVIGLALNVSILLGIVALIVIAVHCRFWRV